MKYLSGLLLSAVALTVSVFAGAQRSRPNLIFILADDLGYSDIGCYGQQKIKTPNIDALARQGTRFTQYYSGSTVCAPARSAFLTGLHTGHTPIRGNRELPPEGQYPLPDSSISFPMLLQQSGYYTAAFGKWSMGFIGSSGDPQKKGFDDFFGYNCQRLAHKYYPDHLWFNHTKIDYPGNPYLHSDYSADIIHAKALETLQKQDGSRPFFLYLPYTLPHFDLTVPHDSLYQHYVKLFNEPPKTIVAKNDTTGKPFEPYPHAAFAAMVSRLDQYVGEVVALVKKKGLDKNTLIIFTSDNGPHKEGGGDPEFFQNTASLRGIKRDLYEGGIRDPMIMAWPGHIRAGAASDHPFALWDFHDTFLELAGIRGAKPTDGVSMVPLLAGKKQKHHDYLYWELPEAGGKQALRWGKWKAVKNGTLADAGAPVELYDLKIDPFEKNNLARQHPEIVAQMAGMMKEAHHPNKDWPLFASEKQ
ncbi:arylsulfatase [Sediminibacterium soli]|uniref:arylsulfatase n=1 Tax=Sediminibacterium soli TaxID=2698829 RepID=UPI00137AACEA|nr:arylsulfatase [Sediminibacterium soli]NCI45246.1 arylsulfatase [Sediminibacterium soli]